MEPLDLDGLFWLEDAPDEQIAGRLTFNAQDGAHLSLIGSFDGLDRFGELGGPVRIHGVAGKRLLTLENSYQIGKTFEMPGIVRERYQVTWILSGDHFREDQAERFIAVHFRTRHLEYWVNRTGTTIETEPSEEQYQLGRVTVIHEPLDDMAVSIAGATLELAFPSTMRFSVFETRIVQKCSFTVRFDEPVSLQEALTRCTALRDLVTIGLDAPSNITQVSLSHADSVRQRSDGEPIRNAIEVFTRFQGSPLIDGDDGTYPANMLFSFDDIGGLDGVAGWLATDERFRPVISVLLAHWYLPDGHAEDRFLNAVIAAEAMERIRTGRQDFPFKEALLKIASDAGELADALVGEVDPWADEVRNMRVINVVHRGLNEDIDYGRMYYLAEAIYILVVISLMGESGVSPTTVSGIQHHRRFQWVADALRKTG